MKTPVSALGAERLLLLCAQGRQFWSCQRAEGPRTNATSNCGHFEWADGGWAGGTKRPHDDGK